jgi:hypothetical protein
MPAQIPAKSSSAQSNIGFGDSNANFRVYVAAPPPMPEYQHLTSLIPLQASDIHQIYLECGNGWRKVFNVYAKLLFALPAAQFPFQSQAASWQQFRDQLLLQKHGNNALCFDAPTLGNISFHLIAGRTHAKQLISQGLNAELHWLNAEFAVDPVHRLLVTPFFDYRQLNNEKIEISAKLLQLMAKDVTDLAHFAAALITK